MGLVISVATPATTRFQMRRHINERISGCVAVYPERSGLPAMCSFCHQCGRSSASIGPGQADWASLGDCGYVTLHMPARQSVQATLVSPLFATLLVPVLALGLGPPLAWVGAYGPRASVGGDVPNLLYLYPHAFLQHFFPLAGSSGLAESGSLASYWSLALLSQGLDALRLVPQPVVAGAVLASTYAGVYTLTLYLLPRPHSWHARVCAALSGTVAVTAPLIAQTFWVNFLPRLYLLPLAPWLLYAVARFVETGKPRFLLLGSTAIVLGSAGVADIPGSLPVALLLLFLLPTIPAIRVSWRRSIQRVLLFALGCTAASAYWVVPFTVTLLAGGPQVSTATSLAGKVAAIKLATALAPLQSVADLLALRASSPLMHAFSWPQLRFSSWYSTTSPLGYIPLATCALGLAIGAARDHNRGNLRTGLYVALLALGTLGFVSLRFPPGSLEAFAFLTLHMPAWVAVRNFYETFAIPYVLTASILVALAYWEFKRVAWFRHTVPLAALLILAMLAYDAPLFLGSAFATPYYAASGANRLVPSLPSGYRRIAARILRSGSSPVLSLPLLTPAWTYLYARARSGRPVTYIGIAPLYYVYGVEDFVGVASFATPAAPSLPVFLSAAAATGNVAPLATMVHALGVRWVVTDLGAARQPDFAQLIPQSSAAAALTYSRAVLRTLRAVKVASDPPFALYQVPLSGSSFPVSLVRQQAALSPTENLTRAVAGVRPPQMHAACTGVVGRPMRSRAPTGALTMRHVSGGAGCLVVLRTPYSNELGATLTYDGHVVSLRHVVAFGFANAFVLPPNVRGDATLRFSNAQDLWAMVAIWVSVGYFALLGLALLPRRGYGTWSSLVQRN